MSFLRIQRLTLGLLAFLAIGWAQTFGLHRGWLCDCGGVEQITQVDHCHGPHSEACHEEEDDHSAPHQHSEKDGDTQKHAAVIESLVAKQQNDSAISLAVPVKLITVNDLWESFCLQVPVAPRFLVESPPARGRPAQEWPRRLAQVIALRI